MEKKRIISRKNPIIPRMGVCDPHMHVFGDQICQSCIQKLSLPGVAS